MAGSRNKQLTQDDLDLGYVDPELDDPDVAKVPDLPISAAKAEAAAVKAKADELGVNPDIADGIKRLLVKYDISPLKMMIELMADKEASKSAKMAAAQAAFPYIHSKPAPTISKPQGVLTTGVMEVPIVSSMEQWMGIAGPSQAALKEQVRQ